jgi:2-polyprenyl-3-methyl-5-hydroxy-6-metoxy-1,4-benzoquinol methylase
LIDFITSHPPGRALDLGCGTGTNVITLAQHGWQAAGIDYIPKAIRAGKKKAEHAGIEVDLRVGNVTNLENLGGLYDLVLDMGCYHGLSHHKRTAYRDNLSHILNPGGTFLLYALTPDEPGHIPGVSQTDIDGFSQILELQSQQEGTDRERPSAWFRFKSSAWNNP